MRKLMSILAVGIALTALPAVAGPVTWTVNGTFADGGTVTGTFVFDAATLLVNSWNIAVAGGDTAHYPAYTYGMSAAAPVYNDFLYPEVQITFYSDNSRMLVLSAIAPLTDAGGTINLIGFLSANNFSGECYNCAPTRFLQSGTLTASPADNAVPEPATCSLVGGAAAALAVYRVRRQSA